MITQQLNCREHARSLRFGPSAQGKGEEGIDCSFERTGAPLRLSQEKSSLERGEESDGEIVGVDVGPEVPVGIQGPEPIADRGRPSEVSLVSGSLCSELAEKAPVVSSDELLSEAPEVVKPKDVHEVPDDPRTRGLQGTCG